MDASLFLISYPLCTICLLPIPPLYKSASNTPFVQSAHFQYPFVPICFQFLFGAPLLFHTFSTTYNWHCPLLLLSSIFVLPLLFHLLVTLSFPMRWIWERNENAPPTAPQLFNTSRIRRIKSVNDAELIGLKEILYEAMTESALALQIRADAEKKKSKKEVSISKILSYVGIGIGGGWILRSHLKCDDNPVVKTSAIIAVSVGAGLIVYVGQCNKSNSSDTIRGVVDLTKAISALIEGFTHLLAKAEEKKKR